MPDKEGGGFDLVFQLLDELTTEDQEERALIIESEQLQPEAEEIEELRRISQQTAEPEPQTYTTT